MRLIQSLSIELERFIRGKFKEVGPRAVVDWDHLFASINKERTVLSSRFAVQEPVSQLSTNMLVKTLANVLDSDYKLGYAGAIDFVHKAVVDLLAYLRKQFADNTQFEVIELQTLIISNCCMKHSELLSKFDVTGGFRKHVEILVLESITFCEDFKNLWLKFFASDQFLDLVDEGVFKMKKFNKLIMAEAQANLDKFPLLQGFLNAEVFEDIWSMFVGFSLNLGNLILDYHFEIRNSTTNQLKGLDSSMKLSKFLTPHIVIASVFRLRYELRQENDHNYKKMAFLMNTDKDLLHNFWKSAVLHFDKVFSNVVRDYDIYNCTIKEIAMVERETDQRLGFLLYLKGSMERYIVHRDPSNLLQMAPIDLISNRWKIYNFRAGSVQGFQAKTVREFMEYAMKERIWVSCKRELEQATEEESKKVSLSALGRLLEDLIFSAKSMKDCLKSFGKNSNSSDGMVSFLVLQIPLVGGTIYTAMEFYGLGKIWKSEHIANDEKMDELLIKVTKVGFTFGAVVSSGIIGQILIPIPVVGALVGGFFGGVISTVVGGAIEGMHGRQTVPYSAFAQTLLHLRGEDGAWRFDQLQALKPLLARWFELSKPSKIDDVIWLTVICFLNISLYHSICSQREDIQGEEKEALEEINKFLELTILFLSERVNILDHEQHLLKIIDTLKVLCKEGYLKMDLQLKKKE